MTAREYGDFLKQYREKYGPATAVFMQVGSFYELYDFQDPATGKTLYNITEVVDILGLNTSSKTDSQSGHTILTAGLPDYALHRWAAKLTQMGWTVVVVDQNKESSGRVRNRTVSRILSPGTHIETAATTDIPSILSILLRTNNETPNGNTQPPSYGIASLDLTTGQTKSYSATCQGTKDTWTADNLQQFTCIFPPKEIIIHQWCLHAESILSEEQFRKQFSIPYHIPIHVRTLMKEQMNTVKRPLYREEQLRTIFSIKSLLSPATILGLRHELEEIALILLAEYAEEHISSNLRNFQKNEAWHPTQNLICANNALHQLQIVPQQQAQGFATHSAVGLQTTVDSVLSLFSPAITPMGKRAIRERIVRPLSDSVQIRTRLESIKTYLNISVSSDSIKNQVETYLRFIYDLPRLHRKIQCGILAKDDVPKLNQSYSAISTLVKILAGIPNLEANFSEKKWTDFIDYFHTHFPIKLSSSNENADIKNLLSSEDSTPLHIDNYPLIGELEERICQTIQNIIELRNTIAQKLAGVLPDSIRIEAREKDAFGLKTSTVIAKSLEAGKKSADAAVTKLSIHHLKSGAWIDCLELSQFNGILVQLRGNLDRECRQSMIKACNEIASRFFYDSENQTNFTPCLISAVENWIENLDCTRCLATTAQELGWVCPTIEDCSEDSWLDITGLRHPIVESTKTRVQYISHDICLGGPGKNNGWLIYGMNASGKSTLMKAAGIAVILAQAGSFVPAKKMSLRPFRAIFTRILNHDNIFSGLSSFAVEMSELRDILRVADKNSLVLGDELCAGTESDSAQALVAAGIEWLGKMKAKFLFATHLHDIPKLIDLPKLGVSVWHIHVHYDPATKRLIYERQLRPGSGSSLYGLEVARAMDLPFEFIESASRNRRKLLGEFRRSEASHTTWNSDIVKQSCEICGTPGKEIYLEVHHIRPRFQADKTGHFSDGEDMNHPRNLIVLCDDCHNKQHSPKSNSLSETNSENSIENEARAATMTPTNHTIISSIQQTSDGPVRNWSTSTNIVQSESKQQKWSDEEIQIIRQTLLKYPKVGLKQVRFILKNENEIEISESTLRKYRSN